jgi:hypothetical protein
MKLRLAMTSVAIMTVFGGIAAANAASKEEQISQAVSALPQALRAGATVISYSPKGSPEVLRQGHNGIICNPNQPGSAGFRVACYGEDLKPQMDMQARLKAEGKDPKAIQGAIQSARDSGKLPTPLMGTAIYSRAGKTEADAHEMWVVLMPNANAEKLGLPTERVNASSPWMMRSGTPNAHIMMPQTASMDETPPPAKRM